MYILIEVPLFSYLEPGTLSRNIANTELKERVEFLESLLQKTR